MSMSFLLMVLAAAPSPELDGGAPPDAPVAVQAPAADATVPAPVARPEPLPPVKAVKAEHSIAVASTVPPTLPPKSETKSALSLWAAPVRANTRPASVNSGSAGNDGLTVIA